jgi:hypothetical protein
VFYSGIAGLRVYSEPTSSSDVVGTLALHEKITRTQVERGYARVWSTRTDVTGWVDNAKLIWRIPAATTAAPAPAHPEADTSAAPPGATPAVHEEPAPTQAEPASTVEVEPPSQAEGSSAPAAAPEDEVAPVRAPEPSPPPAEQPVDDEGVSPSILDAY